MIGLDTVAFVELLFDRYELVMGSRSITVNDQAPLLRIYLRDVPYAPSSGSRLVPKTAAQISLRLYIPKLTFPSHMAYGKEDTVLRRFIGIPYDQSDMPFR